MRAPYSRKPALCKAQSSGYDCMRMSSLTFCASAHLRMLEGSWVLRSGLISTLNKVITILARLVTLLFKYPSKAQHRGILCPLPQLRMAQSAACCSVDVVRSFLQLQTCRRSVAAWNGQPLILSTEV